MKKTFNRDRKSAFWIIGVVFVCALIFFGIQNISSVIEGISALLDILYPLILGAVIARFSGAVATVTDIMKESNVADYGKVMLKALGIGIVVNTVGSVCRDMGENTISNGVELAGKIEILLICLPIITETLSLIKELLT